MLGLDDVLLRQALNQAKKQAFVPSDAVAAAGQPPAGPGPAPQSGGPGGPPSGGAMSGGQPPGPGGQMPGGDPMGGMPPGPSPDSMMGGGGGEVDMKVQRAVQQAMQNMMGPAGGAGGPGGGMKPPKPDINTVATDVFQLKKMFLAMIRQNGMELPHDILDGPNRDPVTGAPSASPTGGSDVGGMPKMGAKKTAADIEYEKIELIKTAADVLRLYAILREHNAAALEIWNGDLEKAAGMENIYGTEQPGHPVPRHEPDPMDQMTKNAAALARRFRVRR